VLIVWDSHPRKIYSYDKGIDILWNKKIIEEKKTSEVDIRRRVNYQDTIK
jgi:hypothetical protein